MLNTQFPCTEMRTGVVYQSGCQDCPATNVGQTERLRAKWIKEHVSPNQWPSWKVCCCRACNEHTAYHQLEQHINKGCHASILAEMHHGDLALCGMDTSLVIYCTCRCSHINTVIANSCIHCHMYVAFACLSRCCTYVVMVYYIW